MKRILYRWIMGGMGLALVLIGALCPVTLYYPEGLAYIVMMGGFGLIGYAVKGV